MKPIEEEMSKVLSLFHPSHRNNTACIDALIAIKKEVKCPECGDCIDCKLCELCNTCKGKGVITKTLKEIWEEK